MRRLGYITAVLLLSLVLAALLHHWWLFVVAPLVFWAVRTIVNRRRYGPAKTRASTPKVRATQALDPSDDELQPDSSRILELLLWPIGRWGFWRVGAVGILLLAALSWATDGFGFNHPAGGPNSSSVLMDGGAPVQHADRSPGMTQQQVLALAGLPRSIRFYSALDGDGSLSQLPPGMATWTITQAFGHDGNREVIWTGAPVGLFTAKRFEPWGTFQLLVVNTGHGLEAVYFPSKCATQEPLGVGPPPHGPVVPITLINVVTSTCSLPDQSQAGSTIAGLGLKHLGRLHHGSTPHPDQDPRHH